MLTAKGRDYKQWVLYDGQCSLCIYLAHKFRNPLHQRGFGLTPLKTEWVQQMLGISKNSPKELLVLTDKGKIIRGADAVAFLARKIWWGWPFYALSRIFGIKSVINWGYNFIALKRHCFKDICQYKDPVIDKRVGG